MKKGIMILLAIVMAVAGSAFGCGPGTDGRIVLTFDGGGGSGNYNSTKLMSSFGAEYNTLEKLADEWNKTQTKYKVVIRDNSLNGMRDAITSMLPAGTAPEMLFQAGGVINDDLKNGWYADLTDYLERPNPYVEGNEHWKDLYNAQELATTRAADNHYYYVCLDKVPVGMMYNKALLEAAGITEIPETYSEFLATLEALSAAKKDGRLASDVELYAHGGLWNEIYLNTSVYGSEIAAWDLDGNHMVSSYELAKAYREGAWSLEDERFAAYLDLLGQKAAYYPNNYLAYDVAGKFAKGKLAITDGLGNNMRIAERRLGDDLVVSGYPKLDTAASAYGGMTGVRGSAGLSTAYWITTSAIRKGQDAVDACVDFLMFLSAPQNNARMVNDLGYALPLDQTQNTTAIFSNLVEQYDADLAAGGLMWSAVNIWGSFGQSVNDVWEVAMGEFYQKKQPASYVVSALKEKLDPTIAELNTKYGWGL